MTPPKPRANEREIRALTEYQKLRAMRDGRKIRAMGNRGTGDSVPSHQDEPLPQDHLGDGSLVGACERAEPSQPALLAEPSQPAQLAEPSQPTQPAAQAVTHQYEPRPRPRPAPNARGTPQKASTKWRFCKIAGLSVITVITVITVIIIAAVLVLVMDTIGANKYISQDPHDTHEPGNQMLVLDERQPHIRLNEAVDIPGLFCLAGRLSPQSRSQPPGVTLDPKILSEVFKHLKDLSDAEERTSSKIHLLRTRAAGIERRHAEISAMPEAQPPGVLARVRGIRQSESLIAQTVNIRQEIFRLRYEINGLVDKLVPRMTAKAQSLCSPTEEQPLMEVYKNRIWGPSDQSVSADIDQLVLLHRGFCSSVRKVINGRPGASKKSSPLSAAQEAGRLHEEVDKLIKMENRTLRNLKSGCGLFCDVVSYAYDLRWGAAAASPSQ